MNGRKRDFQYFVGVEIETEIWLDDYYRPSTCETCWECKICQKCESEKLFCQKCDMRKKQRIIRLLINFWNIKKEFIDYYGICHYCQKYGAWKDVICNYCDRTKLCDIYEPEFYYDDYYELLSNEFYFDDRYYSVIEDIYEDGSAGAEIVSIPFTNVRELYEFLKYVKYAIGDYMTNERNPCGGHINISWMYKNKQWDDNYSNVGTNLTTIVGLIEYMFASENMNYRSSWIYTIDYNEKYSPIHLKNYAWEFRLFDTPYYINNYILGACYCLALTTIDKIVYDNTKLWTLSIKIHEHLRDYGELPELTKNEISLLKDTFKSSIKLTKQILNILSKDLNIDLIKALTHRFKNPFIKTGEIDLNQFRLTEKPKQSEITFQLPLTAFAIA